MLEEGPAPSSLGGPASTPSPGEGTVWDADVGAAGEAGVCLSEGSLSSPGKGRPAVGVAAGPVVRCPVSGGLRMPDGRCGSPACSEGLHSVSGAL